MKFDLHYRGQPVRMEPVIIAGVTGYEFSAIASGGVIPTVTSLLKRLPKPARVAVLAGIFVWAILHLEIVVLPSGRVKVVA